MTPDFMLHHESTRKVGASVARTILAEAYAIDRTWWRGALGFDVDEVPQPVVLSGSMPLFHKQGIPEEDDLFMAFADAAFVVERLSDWARRFRIKWHLRMHDEDWGAIDPSGCTQPLLEQMAKWAHRVRVPAAGKGRWVIDEARRLALAARYPGRR